MSPGSAQGFRQLKAAFLLRLESDLHTRPSVSSVSVFLLTDQTSCLTSISTIIVPTIHQWAEEEEGRARALTGPLVAVTGIELCGFGLELSLLWKF